MICPPSPADESQRLAALRATGLLDSAPEERFDRVTRLASRLFGVPIALVSLIDAQRQWFKSKQGLAASETGRDISFCGHAILGNEPLVVEDALDDLRFADNPLVVGGPGIRFYAGYPLEASDGSKLGTLCIISDKPRRFSGRDRVLLHALATLVEAELSGIDLAANDALTGLANLRGFLEMGDFLLSPVAGLVQAAKLLLLEVKGDSSDALAGPSSGDDSAQMLGVARGLVAIFGDCNLVARVGVRTFAVLDSDAGGTGPPPGQAGCEGLVQRLNANVAQLGPVSVACTEIDHAPSSHRSIEDMLFEAESCLKSSKSRPE